MVWALMVVQIWVRLWVPQLCLVLLLLIHLNMVDPALASSMATDTYMVVHLFLVEVAGNPIGVTTLCLLRF